MFYHGEHRDSWGEDLKSVIMNYKALLSLLLDI